MKIILLSLFCGILASQASAGERPYADKALMDIISWLKTADGYTYNLNITSTMKAEGKTKRVQHIMIYSSAADMVRYISSDEDCSFMNSKGMFKADKGRKTASYKQFASDTIVRRAMNIGDEAAQRQLLDSILFKHASIASKKVNNGMLQYKLSYEAGYMMKELLIVFNTRTNTLVNVSYELERSINGIQKKEAIVQQQVVMSGYKHAAPPELHSLLQASEDLKGYLQKTYTGYSIHNL